MLTFLLVMLIAAGVLGFVLAPLLREPAEADGPDPQLIVARDRAALAKDRKLDEIRELRADVAAGKLDGADGKVLERALRAEAADLLHQLDAAEAALLEATPQPAAAADGEGEPSSVDAGAGDGEAGQPPGQQAAAPDEASTQATESLR